MNQSAIAELVGLDESASADQILEAIAQKIVQLQQAQAKAPTDVLRNKYQRQLDQLQLARGQLTAQGSESGHVNAALSQTKMADLPQSGTQFDAANNVQIRLQSGQLLASRYEIREQIGSGGMGAVYRAYDTTRQDEIALKVLLPGLVRNERARERFLDEARISSKLSHPNIVNVFDVQQDGDLFFLTMELLEGQDLRQLMEVRSLTRQPFTEEEARGLAVTLAQALVHAHQFTVHRDIKPENIWVTEDGDYKIMDFGIARIQSASQRTQTGAAMGTAYYMAPEQLKGSNAIDGRADQYALGVLLYELLAGEVPAGRFRPLRDLRKDLSKRFTDDIEKALDTLPEGRFDDMAAFAQALEKSKGRTRLNLPWKGIGIAAGLLVALLGVGGLASSGYIGLDSLKSLLPMSKEEIAIRKAGLARIQGEIKVLKQRLDSSRRELDSDLRDAKRNDSPELRALENWQQATEQGIFSGHRLTELEGDLSMAETLLRDEAFDQAQPVFEKVRSGFSALLEDFDAAAGLLMAQAAFDEARNDWERVQDEYSLSAPAQVSAALEAKNQAVLAEQRGDFAAALAGWKLGEKQWREAPEAMGDEIARIDAERKAAVAAAKRKRDAEAAEKKRRAELAAAEQRRREAEKMAEQKRLEELARKEEQAKMDKLQPLVRIAPRYPVQAARDGIEGFVIVAFDINEVGAVENVQVVDSRPLRVFDREAKKAVSKWKYKPLIEDGVPVRTRGVMTQLDFTLQ